MRARRAAGAAAAAGALAWAALCGVAYARAFGPRRWGADGERGWTPLDVDLTHAQLAVRTRDGIDLLAWHLQGSLPAVVVVSGGNRGRAGDVLGIGGALNRVGFHVVVYGWRGTPGSGPAAHTLGVHERLDLEAVIDAAAAAVPGAALGLLGYSLGGAVSIVVAADDPRVRAVVADSAFTSTVGALEEGVARSVHLPGGLVSRPVAAALRLRTGADIAEMRPVDAVGRIAPRPLLIIHGERDGQVDASNARRLFAAAGQPRELWMIADAAHVGGYFTDRQAYSDRVAGFLRDALLDKSGAGDTVR